MSQSLDALVESQGAARPRLALVKDSAEDYMAGWIVMKYYDYEGVSTADEPYPVYFDHQEAVEQAELVKGVGFSGEVVEVSVLAPRLGR